MQGKNCNVLQIQFYPKKFSECEKTLAFYLLVNKQLYTKQQLHVFVNTFWLLGDDAINVS